MMEEGRVRDVGWGAYEEERVVKRGVSFDQRGLLRQFGAIHVLE